ncbi:hypothetical protein GBA52_015740 [Prunus armeniaca]|nr:hypothetical protein GBA52_015740 [Prunus armeniaca]
MIFVERSPFVGVSSEIEERRWSEGSLGLGFGEGKERRDRDWDFGVGNESSLEKLLEMRSDQFFP